MAVTAEELNVIIGANVQGLTKAIDRAERRIERFSKQSQKQMSSTSKAFDNLGKAAKKLGPLIATALTVQTIRSLVDTGIEIENLSRVSGIAAERFQELSYAARQFGVQQEKFADIIKDVNDKFGDYIATGAGPLVDFFENIAPKVGVTAEQFAKLSGPQALQLYVSSLEKAGVSQQQMTFYMEALASDATLLIDMFKNNGAAANAMADEIRTAGGVMDEEFIKGSKEAKRQLDLISRVLTAELSDALVHVTPLIKDAAMFIGSMAEAIGKSYNMVREFFGFTSHMTLSELIDEDNRSIARQKELLDEIISRRNKLMQQMDYAAVAMDPELQRLERELRLEKERGIMLQNRIFDLEKREAELKKIQDAATKPSTQQENLLNRKDESGKTTKEAIEETKNAYEDLAESIGSSFDSAFERMIDGTLSVKDAFKEMAISIIKDILRIQTQQAGGGSGGLFSTLARGFSAYFSPGALSSRAAASALPASFASGGMSMGTRPFIAGEHGRELVIPTGTSRILSAPQTKEILQQSGQPVTVNQTFNISTGVAQTVRAELVGLMPAIQQQTVAAVANQKSRGGARGSRL